MLRNATAVRRDTKLVRDSIEADADVKARKKVTEEFIPVVVREIERVSSLGRYECFIGKNMMTDREITVLSGILMESGYVVDTIDANRFSISWAKK